MRHLRNILVCLAVATAGICQAQLNTDRIIAIGRNALYFEDYVLSIQYFNQVIKAKPYLAEPYLYRAIAKIQLGDYTGAENDCNTAARNNPFMPGIYYTRGFVYRQLEEWDKAEADFSEALAFAPENKTYILLRADVRARRGDYESALQDIDYLLRKDPKSPSLNFEKGSICLSKNDTLCALACFSEAIVYDSQNAANRSARGLVNIMLGNDQEALTDLNEAIELGSKWAGDYINRGILHYKLHNYRNALADYDKAVEYDPNNAQCYFNRGLLRAEVGDYNRALDDFNEAIETAPEKTEMYYQRGIINLQLRQWKDAVRDFDVLIKHHPYFLPSYYLAAQAKTALDDPQGAYEYQQTAHRLEENKEEIQRQQAKLNTDVQLADNQPQKKNRRKEFSNRAAQNQTEAEEERKYESESRGTVQKNYTDIALEPNIILSYYAHNQALRRTSYFHYTIDEYNKKQVLPSPLKIALQEIPLTAEMVTQHFEAIDHLSQLIDSNDSAADLYFARAIEFALVQDYSSAIDDCTKAIILQPDFAIAYFCRANWRQKYLEYQRSTGDMPTTEQSFENSFRTASELIMRDYDQVIYLQPDFASAYYNKANILCAQRNWKDAIAYYTQAIEKDHEFAEAYFNRGLTHLYSDEVKQGIDDLSKAGELGIYQAYNLITRFR